MIAALDFDRWQHAVSTWGPRVYGGVVLLFIAVLLLNGRRGEVALFAISAGVVAWLLFADGIDDLRHLPDRVAP